MTNEEGAKLMEEHAEKAVEKAFEAMNDYLQGVEALNEKRKIGAGITAASMLYASVLINVKRIGAVSAANLAMGLFQLHVTPAIGEVADLATVDGTEE